MVVGYPKRKFDAVLCGIWQCTGSALHISIQTQHLYIAVATLIQFGQQGCDCHATVGQHLAHQQIYGLNLIATFINHGHTRVPYDLLIASFADIAVTTKHLQAGDGTINAWSVQAAFSTGVTRLVQRLALLRRAATGWCLATSSFRVVG